MISKFTVTPRIWLRLAAAHGLSCHFGALRIVRGRGISTGEYRRGNSPSGRPHWSGSLLKFKRAPTPELERSPGRPLPSAVSCRLTRLPSRKRVRRTQEVVTPRQGENKENEGESSTDSSAPTHPPLSVHLWGFPFSALPGPTG